MSLFRSGAIAAIFLIAPAVHAQGTATPASILSGESAFNPAISLIMTGQYADLSQDPDEYYIGGFLAGGEHGHGFGPGERGFGLGRTELAISANIDPFFRGEAYITFDSHGGAEIEQGYVTTLGLPYGATGRFGRYLSGIGYVNEQHEDFWDFVDAPLAYKALLGTQYRHDGVQLKWIAPTDLFIEFGIEGGRGLGFPASEESVKNGFSSGAAYVHFGGDVGDSHSWRAGGAYLRTRANERENHNADLNDPDEFAEFAFTGKSRVWVADLVWKWAPLGNPSVRNFIFQAEYIHRRERGELAYDDTEGSNTLGQLEDDFRASQSGWYAQAVYQFMPRWRVGVRYDRVDSGTVEYAAPVLADYQPERKTAMIDFSPSEFSRFRLQYARDESRPNLPDTQIYLQYIMSVGAHGAHRF
ncbi:MAG TPA: TonB-dependent receptor [Burkholderiales bacterium]|nr:TonB-dependent receptor [Burkholderiales bacterium]